ncbi:hypothetical protein TNCV_4253601 [Trichonephila clavipes]|nr:hypothetical protein TNCV_4253601 [Trichonephila clavipes]
MLFRDAFRSEQRVVVWLLIAGGEFNSDIYRRIVAVYGEQCLGQTSGTVGVKVFEKGDKRCRISMTIFTHTSSVKPR